MAIRERAVDCRSRFGSFAMTNSVCSGEEPPINVDGSLFGGAQFRYFPYGRA